MIAEQLKSELDALGLSQADFARLVAVTPRAVNMWMRGDREIPGPVEAYVMLFKSVPDSMRQVELARLKTGRLIMREGMYLIEFHVADQPMAAGAGLLVFENGIIYGADVGEAKYDGEYLPVEDSSFVDIKLKVTFPPNCVSVFGIVQPYEWAIEVATRLDPNKLSDAVVVSTQLGTPIKARYRFVRPLPALAA